MRARGSTSTPKGRFERLAVELDPVEPSAEVGTEVDVPRGPPTEVFRDASRSILAFNDSPDLGFDASLNPYRGCEHGCSYCYARPTHEYLGLSAGLDFETKIFAKPDAPRLLRQALGKRSWKPQVIAISGVTDAYQPIERRLRITRACLEVLAEARNPVAIVTKNHLVTRDADLLGELASHGAAVVAISLTTLRDDLRRKMEPRASGPRARLAAIEALARAGVPVRVMVAPVIPGLNDEEIPAILQAAADAGATTASYVALRLPHGVKELFEAWLGEHFPERREKVLGRIRDIRGGELYDPRFGVRGRGTGAYAEMIGQLFRSARDKVGLTASGPPLSTAAFRRPSGDQLTLL